MVDNNGLDMFGFVFNVNTRRNLQLPPTVILSTDLNCCPRNSLGTKAIRLMQRLNHYNNINRNSCTISISVTSLLGKEESGTRACNGVEDVSL